MALKFGNVHFDSQINWNVGYMKLFSHPVHSCHWKERACTLQSNHQGIFVNRSISANVKFRNSLFPPAVHSR